MAATQTPTADELKDMALNYFWPHSQQVADFEKEDGLHVMADGEGCWVEDTEGRKYIDVLSGMWLKNIGYGRKEIGEAVYQQMQTITYSPENTTNVPALQLSGQEAGEPVPGQGVQGVSGERGVGGGGVGAEDGEGVPQEQGGGGAVQDYQSGKTPTTGLPLH